MECDLLSTALVVSAFPVEERIVKQSNNNNNNDDLKKLGNHVSHCFEKIYICVHLTLCHQVIIICQFILAFSC